MGSVDAPGKKVRVLFLCTGNSCRSQMAQGWCRSMQAGAVEAYSAGTNPHGINPLAVRAMGEVGIDISQETSKTPEQLGMDFDFVLTVCDSAREACPVWPAGTRVLHRSFDDPPRLAAGAGSVDEAMPHYRRVRDEIKVWVQGLRQELDV